MTGRFSSLSQGVGRRVSFLCNRYLELPVIRFAAVSFIVMAAANLIVACWTAQKGVTVYRTFAGGDYAGFYVAGEILNKYPERLYDLALQNGLLHSLLPGIPSTVTLPFLNPPFFGLLFRPLALLPYTASYLLWVAVSISLYAGGLTLIRKDLQSMPRDAAAIGLLLALSFEPFLYETVIGGNSSAFGFMIIVLALCLERRGKSFLSGVAFGLCFYKPNIMLLIAPMIVIARQGRMLLGIFLSGLMLAGVSILTVGWEPCLQYADISRMASHAAWSAEEVYRTYKYVDIFSFSRLLFGSVTTLAWIAIIAGSLVLAAFLGRIWRDFKLIDQGHRDLAWGCTLTWTAVLNPHFGIYDTIIVVPAIMLTANFLYARSRSGPAALPPMFAALTALLYLTPYVSQQLARTFGLQLLTLVLAAIGTYQLLLAVGPPAADNG